MAFQLDTSGFVGLNLDGQVDPDWMNETAWTFADLDAFTQGYIEAMFAAMKLHPHSGEPMLPLPAASRDAGTHIVVGFSSLAPETLAQIIVDCEAASPVEPRAYNADSLRKMGADLWRRSGQTVQLGDDGKVRFA